MCAIHWPCSMADSGSLSSSSLSSSRREQIKVWKVGRLRKACQSAAFRFAVAGNLLPKDPGETVRAWRRRAENLPARKGRLGDVGERWWTRNVEGLLRCQSSAAGLGITVEVLVVVVALSVDGVFGVSSIRLMV